MSYSNENSFKAVIKPGLGRIKRLLEELGNPDKSLEFIHIAGTNGKGSVAAFLKSVLIECGYKVGVFTSPHLIRETERISVNDEEISKADLDRILKVVDSATDKVYELTGEKCTLFERYTAAAMVYFKEQNVDIGVLEAGMGGRLDTTNVIENPLVTIITQIATDHSEFLGDTIEKIAVEKAGIIKKGVDGVFLAQNAEVNKVFEDTAEKLNAPAHFTEKAVVHNPDGMREVFDYKGYKNIICGLNGQYQIDNACTAIEAAEVLKNKGYKISEDALKRGVENAVHHARFERLENGIIFDGAHNPNGMEALKTSLMRYLPNEEYTIIISVMADKDIEQMLSVFKGEQVRFYPVEIPDYDRSMKKELLAKKIESMGFECVRTDTIKEAVRLAQNDKNVIACGSLYLYEYIK